MLSLRNFNNLSNRFFRLENFLDFPTVDEFLCPSFFNRRFFDDSSDEEFNFIPRRQEKRRKILKKPNLNEKTFFKTFVSKNTLDKEGKPVTYSYHKETESQIKDGHQYKKSTFTFKDEKNGNGIYY